MKKRKIGIAIILLVVLFSGLFLWWWTKPIKITTNKIVKVTIKGYDAEVVSSNKQCIQEAIQLVENTRAIPLGDWAVKYIGGDSPDLMVMFRDDKDDAIASVSYYGNIVMDENSYYYLLNSEDNIDEKITQLSKRYEDKKEKKQDVSFQDIQDASWYAQVYEKDFFHIRKEKEANRYAIFKNKNKLFAFDVPQGGYLSQFTRYGDAFYLLMNIAGENGKLNAIVCRVSEKKQTLQKCFKLNPSHIFGKTVRNMVISGNELFYMWNGYLYGYPLDSGKIHCYKEIPEHMRKAGEDYSVADGMFYYQLKEKGKINVYSYDKNSNKEKRWFSYTGTKNNTHNPYVLKMGDWLAITTSAEHTRVYLYNSKTKEKVNFSIADGLENPCSLNKNHFYYVDKKYKLHQYSLKDKKDRVVFEKCIGTVCTENTIYVQKYKKSMIEDDDKGGKVILNTANLQNFYDELESMGLLDEFCGTDHNCEIYEIAEKSGREEKICQQILSREGIQPVKVTDETGKKCTLKLAKLNEKDTGVYFREADPTSVFGQIDNGHYYYLKSNGKREYKICRDEDVFVGEFTLDYGYISGFAKYQNDFYAFITIEEGEAEVETTRQALVRVDLKNKKVQLIIDDYEKTENADSQDNYFWADHLYDYSALYQQYIYHDSRDEVIDKKLDYQPYKSGKSLQTFSINNKEKREKILSTSNMNEAKPYLTFVDGQILYGRQKGKKVYLYAYDLNTKKESEILCYKRKKAYKCYGVPPFHPTNYDCVFVTMDETYIYCQEFAIPRKGGKMRPLLRNAGEYWGGQFAFSTNRKYIFYLDKKYQLHRVDKKTRKDVKLSKKKWMSVYATDEKIYLVEYDEDIVGAYWQEDEGDVVQDHDYPGENALYCMDFQGDMKKVG